MVVFWYEYRKNILLAIRKGMVMRDQKETLRFEKYREFIFEGGRILSASRLLQRAAQRFPTTKALICKDRTVNYKELYFRACLFSNKLRAAGIQPRDRILLMIENSIEFYVAYFGIWQAGAVIAPLNIFLKEPELVHIISDAKPALVVTTQDRREIFVVHGVQVIITTQELDFLAPVPEELLDYQIPILDPDEMVALLYTSGTTGFPKGVMLSSKNIMSNILQGCARIPLDFGQRVFGALPLFHSFAQFACVWASMLTGCTVILVPKIDRHALLDGIAHKPTVFLGVPTLYGLLCLLKTADLSSVEYFISGGDVLPDKIRMGFELIYRRKLCNGYGLTETTPVLAVDLDDEFAQTSCVGRPLLGVSCSIRNENGAEVPHGEIGILWVKGDNIMLGYYQAPDKTSEVLQDGWFNTGDFARIDARGKIIISGREKDLIIHKGFNIYPPEIENVIMMHASVIAVGVIGKDDEESGQLPIAYVQIRKKDTGLEKELRDLCCQHLANYKIPRQFILIEELPLTATGKVDKKVLRKHVVKDS